MLWDGQIFRGQVGYCDGSLAYTLNPFPGILLMDLFGGPHDQHCAPVWFRGICATWF